MLSPGYGKFKRFDDITEAQYFNSRLSTSFLARYSDVGIYVMNLV